ncbi:hypothetical protein CDG77_08915 [Nostoc sp. 'Peltigera membranacea cyanobiont' 213]|nr:hypothetical protein CDG77_08915 [Nostoc sp. 'Peltigera membranacea cyanobiont' 213]
MSSWVISIALQARLPRQVSTSQKFRQKTATATIGTRDKALKGTGDWVLGIRIKIIIPSQSLVPNPKSPKDLNW